MPIFYFMIFLFIAIFIWCVTILGTWGLTDKGALARKIVMIVLVLGTCAVFIGLYWYFGHTAAGNRAWKTQQSNFGNGINREVKVYSVDGKLLEEYHGKFDLEYDNDRILFDDENGMRHIIYYPTGTVIINEVEE